MPYTPVNHNIDVTIGATSGSVSKNDLTVNETDTVTFIPSGGTILAISPDDNNPNLFSSGPSKQSNSENWKGTIGTTTGTENYMIQVQPAGSNPSYWIDPKLQVDQPG